MSKRRSQSDLDNASPHGPLFLRQLRSAHDVSVEIEVPGVGVAENRYAFNLGEGSRQQPSRLGDEIWT